MNHAILAAALVLALCSPGGAQLQCDRGIVRKGDPKAKILEACGEPAFQESRRDERVVGRRSRRGGVAAERRSSVTVDEWTFNFGSGRFLYVVTFESGRVASIERGGYGYPPSVVEEANRYWEGRECQGGGFRIGDLKFDVLMKCGQPLVKEDWEEERTIRIFDRGRGRYREHHVTFLVDEWTYNYGPGRFIYFLRFVNGRLSEIESGGYGY